MSDVKNRLGQKLKELRGDRALNKIEQESGIDRGQLRRYEEGRIPEDHLLQKLADFYEIPYDALKALSFEDLYPEGSKERAALFKWVRGHDSQ